MSWVWKPVPPPRYAGFKSQDIPKQLGQWVSKGDYELSPEVKQALSSGDIVSRSYEGGGLGQPLDFVLIGGTDRSALHDPRSCLIGAGQKIENDHVEVLPGSRVQMRACRVRGGGAGQPDYDMMYVYVVDGQVVDKVTQIRLQILASTLIGRKDRPVYFLRFMVPIASNSDKAILAREHAACQEFARQMWNALSLTNNRA